MAIGGLDDYAQALGAAQQLVPNWRQDDLVEARLQGDRLQNQTQQIAIADHTQDRAYAEQQRAAFQTDLGALGAKPTPQAYRALAVKYPQFHEVLDGAAKGLVGEQAQGLVKRLAPIQSLIASGQYDDAAKEVKRHIDADVAAGGKPDEDDQQMYDSLTSGDPAKQKAVGGLVYGLLAQLDPEHAVKNLADAGVGTERKGQTVGRAIGHYEDGKFVVDYRDPEADKPEYRTITNADGSQSIVEVGGGGGQSSAGGAAGRGSDTSRLINSDAGGGYVPDSVDTLGKFVSYGKALNKRGAKSSSAGTYQINGSTMAEFAPKALGAGWQGAPFNAANQDKVGKAIFDWAKQQPDPAKALRGRWVSLSPQAAATLVQGDWQQAKGVIAQGETGGGAGASAVAPSASGSPGAQVVFTGGGKAGSASAAGYTPGTDVGGLTSSAIDAAAQRYNLTGKMPTGLGRSGAAQQAILSRAAQFASGQNAGDLIAGQAGRQADIISLNQLQKSAVNVQAFERTALRNGALALRLSKTVGNGSVPLFNSWVNAGRRNTGEGGVAAFAAAVDTFTNEFAKITTSATGGGVTSDSARQHARDLINSAQSPEQFVSVMRTLYADMENRSRGLETQRRVVLDRIRGGGSSQAPAQSPRQAAGGFRILSRRPK